MTTVPSSLMSVATLTVSLLPGEVGAWAVLLMKGGGLRCASREWERQTIANSRRHRASARKRRRRTGQRRPAQRWARCRKRHGQRGQSALRPRPAQSWYGVALHPPRRRPRIGARRPVRRACHRECATWSDRSGRWSGTSRPGPRSVWSYCCRPRSRRHSRRSRRRGCCCFQP